MERLGLWGDGTPFKAFETFLEGITKRGLGLFFLCLSWRMYICSGRNSSYIRKVVVYSKTAILCCLHLLLVYTGALEMLAMEMKAAGMYVSRGLSFREAEVKEIFCYCQLFAILCIVCFYVIIFPSFVMVLHKTLHCVSSYIVRY